MNFIQKKFYIRFISPAFKDLKIWSLQPPDCERKIEGRYTKVFQIGLIGRIIQYMDKKIFLIHDKVSLP